MKKNSIVILFAIALLCALVWWFSSNRKAGLQATPSETNNILAGKSEVATQALSAPAVSITRTQSQQLGPISIEERKKIREAAVERSLDEWRAPIEFYGIVVDEATNPVSSVQIDFSCNDLSQQGTSNYHTTSDQQGFFSLSNVNGKLLVVSLSKQGYYTSKRDNDSFEYGDPHGHFMPDKGNPVVFHLRKQTAGEPLITVDYPGFAHIAQLKHDGTPVEIDLFQGTKASEGKGQLRLEFWRDLSDRTSKVFDWKLRITVPGGGLVPTDEEFAFKAPVNGYQSTIINDMQTNAPNWQGQLKSKCYIRSADGKFGRIEFEFLPFNGVFTIHSVLNPSGSQNLEPAQ